MLNPFGDARQLYNIRKFEKKKKEKKRKKKKHY